MLNVETPDKLYDLFMKVTELEPSKEYILVSDYLYKRCVQEVVTHLI